MSLPAYMYLYDENGQLIKGSCMALDREGAIEIMNSSYGVYQSTCRNTTGFVYGLRGHISKKGEKDHICPADRYGPCLLNIQ